MNIKLYAEDRNDKGQFIAGHSSNQYWKGKKRPSLSKLFTGNGNPRRKNNPLLKSRLYKPRTGKVFTCPICSKDFYRSPFHTEYPKGVQKRYCSRLCANKGMMIREELVCRNCGKMYECRLSQQKWRGNSRYCSLKCRIAYKHINYVKQKGINRKKNSVLKKHLWMYFSQYIRQRDNGICISCGKKDYWRKMDAGHYVPKTAGLSLYFHEQNVHCQCTYCNRWMHGNLSRYAIALRKRYGEAILEELESLRVQQRKITDDEYIALIEKYKALLPK